MKENKDQPAFACVSIHDSESVYNEGLTKREYFAGLAMQGLSVNRDFSEHDASDIASIAIDQADELLKQLKNDNGRNN